MANYSVMRREEKQNINFNSVPFCIERISDTTRDSLHIHDFNQLTVVVRGSASIVINGMEQRIREGNVYVISNYSAHYLKDQQNFEVINIMFYVDELMKYAASLKEQPGFQSLFVLQPSLNASNRLSNMLLLDYEGIYYVNDIVKKLLSEVESGLVGKEIIVQSYFMILVVYLSRQYEKDNSFKKNTESLYKIVSYMNDNYDKKITIEELIGMVHISERQLRQMFSDEYGCSPLQYLISLRIKHACYLLAYSDMNISEIAGKVGFDDSNYFARKFRQVLGMSPSEYAASRAESAFLDKSYEPTS